MKNALLSKLGRTLYVLKQIIFNKKSIEFVHHESVSSPAKASQRAYTNEAICEHTEKLDSDITIHN